jgi:hypothetical protein
MVEGRSEGFKKRFLVMHFFNPVRYMKLLELVAGPETDPNNTNGDPYIYDFAAQWNEWATGAYYLHGVAGGNGVTKVTAKNDCASGPVTS